MRLLIKMIVFSLCILNLFNIVYANPKDTSQYLSVKWVVEEYCLAEFNGDRYIRQDLATYSRKRLMEEKKKNPELIAYDIMSWEGDPLYVVSAFKILDIKIEKKKAVVTVEYFRLAKTEGFGHLDRKIIPDYNEHDIMTLNLIYEKGKWKIIDPPLPRISKDALLRFFKKEKEEDEKYIVGKPTTSKEQMQGYFKIKENIEILEKLEKK